MSETPNNSEASIHEGFAVAAIFGLLATLFWIAPWYVGFSGTLEWVCFALGGVSIAVSFGGAFEELSKLLQRDVFSWFGIGMAFFAVAVVCHILATYAFSNVTLVVGTKVLVLVLVLIGGGMVFFGLASIFEPGPQDQAQSVSDRKGHGNAILTVLSFVSSTLPILGYIVNVALRLFGE